jgi:acyl-CoA carboxylase subunit beta
VQETKTARMETTTAAAVEATNTILPQTKRLKSKIDSSNDQFKERYGEMHEIVADLQEKLTDSLEQGRERDVQRHWRKGLLLARDRVEAVIDPGSPFLELMGLAGYGQDDIPIGASMLTGIGLVAGVECMITANVPTLSGGAINEVSVLKGIRTHTICMENRLPCINLTQTVLHNFPTVLSLSYWRLISR